MVEQEAEALFNKGALVTAGYLLSDDADYVCVHDGAYAPIWVDYRRPDEPTPMCLTSGPAASCAA